MIFCHLFDKNHIILYYLIMNKLTGIGKWFKKKAKENSKYSSTVKEGKGGRNRNVHNKNKSSKSISKRSVEKAIKETKTRKTKLAQRHATSKKRIDRYFSTKEKKLARKEQSLKREKELISQYIDGYEENLAKYNKAIDIAKESMEKGDKNANKNLKDAKANLNNFNARRNRFIGVTKNNINIIKKRYNKKEESFNKEKTAFSNLKSNVEIINKHQSEILKKVDNLLDSIKEESKDKQLANNLCDTITKMLDPKLTTNIEVLASTWNEFISENEDELFEVETLSVEELEEYKLNDEQINEFKLEYEQLPMSHQHWTEGEMGSIFGSKIEKIITGSIVPIGITLFTPLLIITGPIFSVLAPIAYSQTKSISKDIAYMKESMIRMNHLKSTSEVD